MSWCSPGPRQGQCLDPSIQSPPYTSPHHLHSIYTFFSRLFPTQLQLSSCLIEMTVTAPRVERCDGVSLSVRGDEPQLSGVWGQAAAAQQLGFLGKQTRHQSWTTGYQRHTRSEGQGLFTYPFIISLLLLQLKCLNKKFFDIS